MSTARRILKDESGMTMGLAVMMILLLGVMGAGLLTFVSRDLNTVLEENRGQRAFEVADAGIGAAKRQLASGVTTEARTLYDDPIVDPLAPVDDIQWSAASGGLTLNDLDGKDPDGAGPLADPTPDSVNVTIKYCAEASSDPQCAVAGSPPSVEYFRVVSTGTYGDAPQQAKRKIEARFDGVVSGGGGGETIGHPLYYTPSDIRIESQVTVNGISLFSEQDILIQGLKTTSVTDTTTTAVQSFVDEYENSGGTLQIPNTDDELCNWRTDIPLTQPKECFKDAAGPWNTVGRTKDKKNGTTDDWQEPGFAAEGKICGFTAGTAKGECGATELSAADGVYGYDSTTANKTLDRTAEGYTNPWGNHLTFVDKGNLEPNVDRTITYPFPRPTPIPEGFKRVACQLPPTSPITAVAACAPSASNDYFVANGLGSPSATDWENLLSSDLNRIAFVDAQNQPITINVSGETKGILVVWCGQLTQQSQFRGIILNLHGDGSAFGSTDCSVDHDDLGTYTNGGAVCHCWVYADGGTPTTAGMTLKNGSQVFFYSGSWSFLSGLFASPPPTSFALHGWRELYE